MTNGFRGLLVGWGEPIYVKLKEVEKLAVRHFKPPLVRGGNPQQFLSSRFLKCVQICIFIKIANLKIQILTVFRLSFSSKRKSRRSDFSKYV